MLATTADPGISRPTNPSEGRDTSPEPIAGHTTAGPVQSVDLLRGEKTVGIMHNGALYRLQATKLGKLILTK
ncbi:MAG: hemin uptake protein HemP [Gammaproteobacteria bacterium]|nr:hemin uptake protein HemP [Gammaproteobacteria bacterium]MBU1442545.1 hemin uptake protein HemP [Gammaproteobacteria bacterium]MBU2287573.1 hemin uptake protein HemP [Gammaproteobacteria bacterium]MBU2409138.1 hemin uptake protein HemP [Gammaproteobacteria bacterium]